MTWLMENPVAVEVTFNIAVLVLAALIYPLFLWRPALFGIALVAFILGGAVLVSIVTLFSR